MKQKHSNLNQELKVYYQDADGDLYTANEREASLKAWKNELADVEEMLLEDEGNISLLTHKASVEKDIISLENAEGELR